MKKAVLLVSVVLALLAVSSVASVMAQDEDNPIAIAYGDVVEGEIENDAYEVYYTFEGSEDDIVLIEMFREPGTFDLDTRLELRDDDGDLITENDDFTSTAVSVILYELDNDDEFTIVASRYGGEDGSGEGTYTLRLTLVEPSELGDSFETEIFPSGAEDEDNIVPDIFVFQPEDDVMVRFTYSQEFDDELFGAINLSVLGRDQQFSVYATLVSFNPSIPLSEMSFTMELEGGETYVLWVSRSWSSYPFEGDPIPVTVSTEVVE